MKPELEFAVTIICAVIASSGFWAFIQKIGEHKDSKTQMLVGLAHDRIVTLGMSYLERGWISQDEFENLYDYLYTPYVALGGNGTAKHIMEEVIKLDIKSGAQIIKENRHETE